MKLRLLTTLPALLVSHIAAQPVITTIAGTDAVFAGEGQRAEEATLGAIRGVAIDRNGVVVFTDSEFGLVLKLGPNNILEVVAGTGVRGYSGDNGPARAAQLGRVGGVAVDADGNIYAADGNRVRKISTGGIISTIAGGGTNRTGEDIPATEASILQASGIAVDSNGNVYVTDLGTARVRRISPDGRIRTFAGTGQSVTDLPTEVGDGGAATDAILVRPIDVVTDRQGGVLIVDQSDGRVRRVAADGTIRTVAGGGLGGPPPLLASTVSLGNPSGVAIAPDGSLYVMTIFQFLKIGPDQRVTSLNGSSDGLPNNGGSVSRAGFKPGVGLNAMASDADGNIYVADSGNYQLRRVGSDGIVHAVAGNGTFRREGENWPAAVSNFNSPTRLATGPQGQVFVLDRENCRIREIQSSGLVRTLAGNGVCSTLGGTNYSPDGVEATSIGFGALSSLAVDANGDLHVLDGIRVVRIMQDGRLAAVVNRRSFRVRPPGDGIPAVDASLDAFGGGIAFDRAGNLYIAETNTHRIRKVTPTGIISTIAGSGPAPGPGSFSGDGGPALEARLNRPRDVIVDRFDNIFILDTGNSRIRKIDAGGIITTIAVTGTPNNVWSQLAIDSAGDLYVSDSTNHRVRRIAGDGTITSVAGTGQPGFSGDGGRPEDAQLNLPSGLAIDAGDNMYIADTENHRVRLAVLR